MLGRNGQIDFQEPGIAQQLRAELARHPRELCRCCEYLVFVRIFVVAVVQRFGAFLGHQDGAAIHKTNYGRHLKDVLIETREEEGAVALDWSANRESGLLLPVAGLEVYKWVYRI